MRSRSLALSHGLERLTGAPSSKVQVSWPIYPYLPYCLLQYFWHVLEILYTTRFSLVEPRPLSRTPHWFPAMCMCLPDPLARPTLIDIERSPLLELPDVGPPVACEGIKLTVYGLGRGSCPLPSTCCPYVNAMYGRA